MCEDLCLVGLGSVRGRLLSLRGLVTGEALSLRYFSNRRLRAWSRAVLREKGVRRVLAFSSPMAQYVMGMPPDDRGRLLLDMVDVDSDKWLQYARWKRWPMSWLYAREGRLLLGFERRVASEADRTVFISETEASLFRRLAPQSADRVVAIENGVDGEFFKPRPDYADPYEGRGPVVVFTGAMDYWPNVDAVRWFAERVWPQVRESVPQARFFIVGARPTDAVRLLARRDEVVVTGWVEDVRPYLAHARLAVAPLRIARGIQNKVLEAMAMAVPVLASPAAMEGIQVQSDYEMVPDGEKAWIRRAVEMLNAGDSRETGARLRERVIERYAWEGKLEALVEAIEGHVN